MVHVVADLITNEKVKDQCVTHSLELLSTLIYRQDDNGFNAMIGAFAGLVVGGVLAKSFFDFNDNFSSIAGFSVIIGGTAAVGLIGYNTTTALTYSLPLTKTKKP